MEVNQLPTKPGPYYWRKSDGGEWARVFNVRLSNSIGLCVDEGFYHESVEQRGGQWLPIPTAEELVELQAKAKMYDKGHEAWAVKCPAGQLAYTGTQGECSRKCADLNGKPIRRFYMPTEADSLDYGVSSDDKVRYHMHHLYMGDHSELWIVGIDQASGNEISRYPASRVTCIEWEVPR